MEIFIGNLPSGATTSDVRHLLGFSEAKPVFSYLQQNETTDDNTQYIIVAIESNRVAAKAMAKMCGARLHGQPLIVRECKQRTDDNDRRLFASLQWQDDGRRDGRRQDRRQVRVYDDRRAVITEAVPGRTWRHM